MALFRSSLWLVETIESRPDLERELQRSSHTSDGPTSTILASPSQVFDDQGDILMQGGRAVPYTQISPNLSRGASGASSIGFSDLLPNGSGGVSVPVIHLLYSDSQNLGFVYVTCKSGLCRLRVVAFPEHLRIGP